VVAEGEDARVKIARERRVRREVLEVVQKVREQKVLKEASEETAYLQRRVIALLQKMQEVTEENSLLRQITISQYYALDRIPALEEQIKQLRGMDYEREAAVSERRYLMNALSKLKTDRDFLDELLTSAEEENARAARLLSQARAELAELKERKWWHSIYRFLRP
jgi:phage I-like protein